MARKRPPSKATGNPEPLLIEELRPLAHPALEPKATVEGVSLEDADLSDLEAPSVTLTEVLLRKVDLSETKLRGLHLGDVQADNVNGANGSWQYTQMRRVTFQDSTLVGLDLANGELASTTFSKCKLDLVNLRQSSLEDVVFSSCSLRGTDFYGAKLSSVTFEDCQLEETDFSQATLELVDLRGSTLVDIRGVSSLKGAIIDGRQLIDLAPFLANELGIAVEEA